MTDLFLAVSLASAGTNSSICSATAGEGSIVIGGFGTLISIGKYLLITSFFLGSSIWLSTEFFREGQTGSFKISSFVIHNLAPLMVLIVSAGLLFGFGASDILHDATGGAMQAPC